MTHAVAVLEPGYRDYAVETAVLAPLGASVTAIGRDVPAEPVLARLGAAAILVRERKVTTATFDACPGLRAVVRYGIGVDNIDLDAARARRIFVANVPDYGAEHEVSNHALALFLAVSRRLITRDREVRGGAWDIGQAAPIPGHRDAVLGLIGFGRIAREARRKFACLGFRRTLAFDPYVDDATMAAEGVERADVDTIVRQADLVSLHAPLTGETRHILDARRIGLMKPTAIVVNVSRGGLIDEPALAAALREGRVFGAGLDVFEREPPLPGNPLLAAPNAVLSDHVAWYSEDSVHVLQERAAREVARVLSGQEPVNWVNRW